MPTARCAIGIGIFAAVAATTTSFAAQVSLLRKKHDPYGTPRPAAAQQNVPLRTTFSLRLAAGDGGADDTVDPHSVSIVLKAAGGQTIRVLDRGGRFAAGYAGRLFPGKTRQGRRTLDVYVDPERRLAASTTYTIRVEASSRRGADLPAKAGTWTFTTAKSPEPRTVEFRLSLDERPVVWRGAFFSGFCKPSFCTSSLANRIASYELMAEVRKTAPRAWSLQRDVYLTGMDDKLGFLPPHKANVVRERETRRITKIEQQTGSVLLHVEDFFGHEQYGIESDRPLSGDYRAGDVVLIADNASTVRTKVIGTDDRLKTVAVETFDTPQGGWQLDYLTAPPKKENPDVPGLFAMGGCHLRKFKPVGTPAYYWGRVDHEWDIVHRRFGRRIMPNFTEAPGDLSIDGRNWTTAKDYAQLHEATRTIAGHIIDRYGEAALDFPWSVFNEPDLSVVFWRSDWDELQRFYDYTVDAILRAFEDRGYDSGRVMVGGLELGAIFGTHLKLREFLIHCSPNAEGKGALPANAAFADARLDGKRSRRVEKLCRAHGGKGSPCDFVSVHAYNASKMMADKLIRAKEMALEIDADYYAKLWVDSHESCPGWQPQPDPAYGDSFLGNGYFPTWCADVVARQLQQAAVDRRYAFGETILTLWPWPIQDFSGGSGCTRALRVDDDGDGKTDRTVTVPSPILHFLGLLNGMGEVYWVLPARTIGAHTVSGFAGRSDRDVRLLVYSHAPLDTESRSQQTFDVDVEIDGLEGPAVDVTQYRFDKDHHSYFRLARLLRDESAASRRDDDAETQKRLRSALEKLASDEKPIVLQGLSELRDLGSVAQSALTTIYVRFEQAKDEDIRKAAFRAVVAIYQASQRDPIPAVTLRQVRKLVDLRATQTCRRTVNGQGVLRLRLPVAGNGANFVVLSGPASPGR